MKFTLRRLGAPDPAAQSSWAGGCLVDQRSSQRRRLRTHGRGRAATKSLRWRGLVRNLKCFIGMLRNDMCHVCPLCIRTVSTGRSIDPPGAERLTTEFELATRICALHCSPKRAWLSECLYRGCLAYAHLVNLLTSLCRSPMSGSRGGGGGSIHYRDRSNPASVASGRTGRTVDAGTSRIASILVSQLACFPSSCLPSATAGHCAPRSP